MVIRGELSARANPGKPAALGGAAQPSYFQPATDAGRADALGEAEVVELEAVVELLVNWAEATAAMLATKAARMKLDETIFDFYLLFG